MFILYLRNRVGVVHTNFSSVCRSRSFARDTNRVTRHRVVPAFDNSVWRGRPNRQTQLQEVAPCQDNFMHLIFMRNMILQCCGGGQFQLLMAFQGPCDVPKLLQAPPRDTHLATQPVCAILGSSRGTEYFKSQAI